MALFLTTVALLSATANSLLDFPGLLSNGSGVCVPSDSSAVTTKQTGKDCSEYGNAPAKVLNDLEAPDGLLSDVTLCGGQIVKVRDNLGEARSACLYANPSSTADKPLPLVVWLHPSLVSASAAWPLTGLDLVKNQQALNNEDASAVGFSYLLPFGRNTVHIYPPPLNDGLGWDNWYRNLDRSSPSLNTDVDFLDKAIAVAKKMAHVDNRRIFMSGWSNGAAMALLYAMNTEGIAAASVYSAPDPYRDSQDPCAQTPHPSAATPIQDVHNYCDIIGFCNTAKYFYQDIQKRYSALPHSFVVVDTVTEAVKSKDDWSQCDPLCQSACYFSAGTVAHLRWPTLRNGDTFFPFLKQHPLPLSGAWGQPR